MKLELSEEIAKILEYAKIEAMRTGSWQAGTGHLVLALLRHGDNDACRVLARAGVDPAALKLHLDAQLFRKEAIPYAEEERIAFSRDAENTVSLAFLEASMAGQREVRAVHLLLSAVRSPQNRCTSFLEQRGVSYARLSEEMRAAGLLQPEIREEKEEKPAERLLDVIELIGRENKIFS
ncbi:MAG: hypothetical protein J6W83_04865 [Bacteroidales bacterium]|nr:hypothetical protein [Bacteroidales bacterium]